MTLSHDCHMSQIMSQCFSSMIDCDYWAGGFSFSFFLGLAFVLLVGAKSFGPLLRRRSARRAAPSRHPSDHSEENKKRPMDERNVGSKGERA